MSHPLDRPIWNALTTCQSHVAEGDASAMRMDADCGLFAASRDLSGGNLAGLAKLIPQDGVIGLVETSAIAPPPGTAEVMRGDVRQMMATRIARGDRQCDAIPLTDNDAEEMLALATLTEPGPFFRRTHQLGAFIGVRQQGKLVAMAGERLKLSDGSLGHFTEVSAVCTHPDWRGKGYGGGLMRIVAERILARGETPFLHVYAGNSGAIALYERLGFRFRSAMIFTVLRRTP
jgi:predicted GNAT family acetyltransferase